MTNQLQSKPPIWFWIVSVIALFWNAMGVDQYIGQAYKTERWRASISNEQFEIISNLPAWLTAAFAIAVFAATIGSVGLILKQKWAYHLLVISLIAVVIQMGYYLMQGYTDHLGMTLSIIGFAIFLVWFSKKSVEEGWLD